MNSGTPMRITPGVFGVGAAGGAVSAATSFTSFASFNAFDSSRTFIAALSPGGISKSAGSSVVASNSVTSILAIIGLPSSPVTVVVYAIGNPRAFGSPLLVGWI